MIYQFYGVPSRTGGQPGATGRHRAQAQSRPRLELCAVHLSRFQIGLIPRPDHCATCPTSSAVLDWHRTIGGVSASAAACASSIRRNTSSRSRLRASHRRGVRRRGGDFALRRRAARLHQRDARPAGFPHRNARCVAQTHRSFKIMQRGNRDPPPSRGTSHGRSGHGSVATRHASRQPRCCARRTRRYEEGKALVPLRARLTPSWFRYSWRMPSTRWETSPPRERSRAPCRGTPEARMRLDMPAESNQDGVAQCDPSSAASRPGPRRDRRTTPLQPA